MSEEHVARKVKSVKDHPALLTWLMNDERPLSMLSRIHTRYRTIRENASFESLDEFTEKVIKKL
jgi:hypothetical protein